MRLIPYIGIPAAILAALTIWITLGFPRLATSGDIERLSRKQAEQAVELYGNKVRSFLVQDPPTKEPNRSIWMEEINKAKRQQNAAEQRWLELSK